MGRNPYPQLICFFCKHFDAEAWSNDELTMNCAAFPEGIPELIVNLGYDHREPLAMDNGLRFEFQRDVRVLQKRLPSIFNEYASLEWVQYSLSFNFSFLSVGRAYGDVMPRPRSYPR